MTKRTRQYQPTQQQRRERALARRALKAERRGDLSRAKRIRAAIATV